jgi:hypothetical protein
MSVSGGHESQLAALRVCRKMSRRSIKRRLSNRQLHQVYGRRTDEDGQKTAPRLSGIVSNPGGHNFTLRPLYDFQGRMSLAADLQVK